MMDTRHGPIALHVTELLHRVREWASDQPSVAAVALAGSHAHGRARPDSDIDLIILFDAPDRFRESGWLGAFGTVTEVASEQWGILTAHRVRYQEHGEVEVGVVPETWADVPVDSGTKRVVSDGIVAVYDPHELLRRLVASVRGPG